MGTTSGFRRQHRELQQLAASLVREAVRSQADAVAIRRRLSRFVGKLRVHAAMETQALYPSLLESPDARVRAKAERLHDELGPLYGLVDDFVERWDTAERIDGRRVRFRIELTRMIAKLGWRMMREDRELYPMADAAD
ncbi:MAG: hemerythrin domain-containing protein [Sandaracinaceae bacterium]